MGERSNVNCIFFSDMSSNRDVDAIAAKLGTAPVYLDADADSSVPNGPVGGQTRVTLRNDHLSYLITWSVFLSIKQT